MPHVHTLRPASFHLVHYQRFQRRDNDSQQVIFFSQIDGRKLEQERLSRTGRSSQQNIVGLFAAFVRLFRFPDYISTSCP